MPVVGVGSARCRQHLGHPHGRLHQLLRPARTAQLPCHAANEGTTRLPGQVLLGDPDGETTRQREALEETALSVSTRIRITLENLAKLRDTEGVEARYSAPEDGPNHVSLSVFRFDKQELATPHLARLVGHDSPLMHLRRRDDGGMFDRFSDHADELWTRARPVWHD